MKTLSHPADKTELLRRLQAVSPDTPAKWGRMSAQQMICHVTDAFRGPLKEKSMSIAQGWYFRPLMKWFALSAPFPWPKNMGTLPEMDQRQGGTPPTDFAADVANLNAALERFSTRGTDFVWPPHPIFIAMSHDEWMRWGYLHMDHHLRQFGA